MDMVTILGLVVIVVFGLAFGMTLFKDTSKSNNDGKKKENENRVEGKVVGNRKNEINQKDIFEFMEFDKILDNMIVQEKETKYTMIIQCKGINYDLMSEIEQMAVEEGFIVFLNTLKFPVQLYVQARAIDLKKSMNIFNQSVEELRVKYNDADSEYKQLASEINFDFAKAAEVRNKRDRMAHIYDYAQDITQYVERISLNKHVLQRKFYIALSYYKSEITASSEFSHKEIHEICYRELFTRAQSVISALMSCSVSGRILNSNELAELLYISYNRDDEKLLDVRTALESGFYRLYSTSKDVFEKREEAMQKQVEEEAKQRVKEAIYQTINGQEIKTEEDAIEEFEERVDREAINIINAANIDPESKEQLTNIIAENHVAGVQERRREKMQREESGIENKNENHLVEDVVESIEEKIESNSVSDTQSREPIFVNKNLEISVAEKERQFEEENAVRYKERVNESLIEEMYGPAGQNAGNPPFVESTDSANVDDLDDEIIV